jgi:hypothetical protein
MAKKIDVKETVTTENEVLESIGVELNNTAVSIVSTGPLKYAVVKIKFDAKTGVTGSVEVVNSDLDFYEAQHQFKILTVNVGIFG